MIAAGLLVAAATQAWAFREGDSQLWLNAGAESGLGKDVRVGIDTGSRWGDSMSDYFYQAYEPSLTWKAAPWLDVTPSVEYIQQEKSGKWLDETVPKLTVQIKGDAGPLTLSNRSRMEYRLREAANDEWRYRDRLRLQLTKGVTAYKIRPYIEEELYYSFDEQLFNESRAAAGFGFEPVAWLKTELYFMGRSTLKSDVWTDSNIVGAKVTVLF